MSGLFSSLSASVQALTAQSRALEISGKNLANVNNPDYARQRVQFGDLGTIETPTGPESMGIQALGIEQLRDSLLDQQVMREGSLSAYYQAQQSAYQRAQAGLGQNVGSTDATSGSSTTTDNGIGAALDDFFNAYQSLAASPTDTGQRQALLQKAQILSDRFKSTDERLGQVQADLGTQITTDVASVNTMLQNVAALNIQIARLEINRPGGAVDLRDQRQAVLEQLAGKLPISITEASGGQVLINAKDSSGSPVALVTLTGVTAPVTFNGTQLSAGATPTVLGPTAGSIQGSLSARDDGIQAMRDQLDQLAEQLVTSVNAAYNPSGSTGNFFTAGGTTAATFTVDSTVTAMNLKASDGGAAGDNTVALAVAALADRKFSTAGGNAINGTFTTFYSTAVSGLGQSLSAANSQVSNQSSIEQLVRTQRDSVSGVSLDEEMANLLKYQRAFQASSRVFSTIDSLLDNVVNQLGR
ncbi:MAG: flagellar hook-associated protein FlgK [Verrucomicrobia bacterium]|nr:flagellar hook-associated protein FlgK [Verrucomicrobiota bacterium]